MRDLHELGLESNSGRAIPPPSPEQLALVEKLVGHPLPQSYVDFLRFCNVCHPIPNFFRVQTEWGTRGYLVAAFFPISANTANTDDSSEVAWHYRHRGPGVPRGIVPIAMTPFGDEIYLDLTSRGNGRVVLAQHGLPAWASGNLPAKADLVIYVAPSFEAFVDMLTDVPEEE